MPNLANAKKALRQNLKRADRNKEVRAEIASLSRHFRTALKASKLEEAKKAAQTIAKKMDKAVSRNVMKKNTVARVKSRMASSINKLTVKK